MALSPAEPEDPTGTGNQSFVLRELYEALTQGELTADTALDASGQILQTLLDSMTNAVFWKDRQSRYLGSNKVFAGFFGFDQELLLGQSDRDMPWFDESEYDAEWFMDWDRHVFETGEPVVGILERLKRADGEERWVETNKVPLLDIDGNVIGLLGTFQDITDRHHAQAELEQTLNDLDARVQRRTSDLVRANDALRREVQDRVRLQGEERRQREFADALRNTAAAISGTLDLDTIAENTLTGLERLVSCDLACLVLNQGEELKAILGRSSYAYLAPDTCLLYTSPSPRDA